MSDERIRVLHIITRLIRGGADENTVFTVEGVDPERYEAHILGGRGSEVSGFSPTIQKCTRILPELVRDPNPWLDLVALFKMVRILRRGRYQIVHTHTAKAGLLGRVAARLAGTPHIIHTLHGVTFHDHVSAAARWFYITLERIAARFTDVLISVGDDVKSKYIAASIGSPAQYITIPSGMDTQPFRAAREHPEDTRDPLRREFGFTDEDLVLGMVSRLEPRKGYRFLFRAAAQLAPEFPHLRLLLVGEGDEREHLQAMTRELGIEQRVVFAGYRSDIANTISTFDVAVLTSLWEGLPRVLVQCSLLEKPIVTFEVEGSREVIEDGVNGYVVPLKNVDALVDRLRRVLQDPDLRLQFGQRSRARVEGRWDVSIMVRAIADVYENVLTGRPVQPLQPIRSI